MDEKTYNLLSDTLYSFHCMYERILEHLEIPDAHAKYLAGGNYSGNYSSTDYHQRLDKLYNTTKE